MEQVAYINYARRELRKAREREAVYVQVILILSVACITLISTLALYCNL